MKGTWPIGRLAGAPLRVHWSLPLVLLGLLLPVMADPAGWWLEALFGLSLLLALGLAVTAHEAGHILAARGLGIPVREIVLLPIGGLAQIGPWAATTRPGADLLIALAGPAANLGLALALLPLAWLASGGPSAVDDWPLRELGHLSPAGVATALWQANLAVAGLSLLPILPLDGGRALRAGLTPRLGLVGAARLTAVVGLAVAGGLLGLALWLRQPALAAAALPLLMLAGLQLRCPRVVPGRGIDG